MEIDWTKITLAFFTALPPSLLALAALVKCFKIDRKAEHIEQLTDGGVKTLGAEVRRLQGIIDDLQSKDVSASVKRGDVHGPSAGDSYR